MLIKIISFSLIVCELHLWALGRPQRQSFNVSNSYYYDRNADYNNQYRGGNNFSDINSYNPNPTTQKSLYPTLYPQTQPPSTPYYGQGQYNQNPLAPIPSNRNSSHQNPSNANNDYGWNNNFTPYTGSSYQPYGQYDATTPVRPPMTTMPPTYNPTGSFNKFNRTNPTYPINRSQPTFSPNHGIYQGNDNINFNNRTNPTFPNNQPHPTFSGGHGNYQGNNNFNYNNLDNNRPNPTFPNNYPQPTYSNQHGNNNANNYNNNNTFSNRNWNRNGTSSQNTYDGRNPNPFIGQNQGANNNNFNRMDNNYNPLYRPSAPSAPPQGNSFIAKPSYDPNGTPLASYGSFHTNTPTNDNLFNYDNLLHRVPNYGTDSNSNSFDTQKVPLAPFPGRLSNYGSDSYEKVPLAPFPGRRR